MTSPSEKVISPSLTIRIFYSMPPPPLASGRRKLRMQGSKSAMGVAGRSGTIACYKNYSDIGEATYG
jgi:hypothetical protein